MKFLKCSITNDNFTRMVTTTTTMPNGALLISPLLRWRRDIYVRAYPLQKSALKSTLHLALRRPKQRTQLLLDRNWHLQGPTFHHYKRTGSWNGLVITGNPTRPDPNRPDNCAPASLLPRSFAVCTRAIIYTDHPHPASLRNFSPVIKTVIK